MLRIALVMASLLFVAPGCAASQEEVEASEGAASVAPGIAKALDASKLNAELHCNQCHATASKSVGPSYTELAERFGKRTQRTADGAIVEGDATVERLADIVLKGSQFSWGVVPMPRNPIRRAEAEVLVRWILDGGDEGAWTTR